MAEDHQKVELRESEFLKSKNELSEKLEQAEEESQKDKALLESRSQLIQKLTTQLNSEKTEKERLEKRLQNSFLDEFRDKIAEI